MACRVYRRSDGSLDKVLAPNGKESKLYKSLVNIVPEFKQEFSRDPFVRKALSEGKIRDLSDNELALGLYAKFDLDVFKKWHEGNTNLIVDENEEPRIFFHGSTESFEEFKEFPGGIYFADNINIAKEFANRGLLEDRLYYLAISESEGMLSPEEKAEYSSLQKAFKQRSIYPVVLKASNVLGAANLSAREIDRQDIFKQYDAIVDKYYTSSGTTGNQYVVKSASQIKSIFNIGDFSDPKNIYFQLGNEQVHNADVSAELIPLLTRFGISVESLSDYAERTGQQFDDTVAGLADPFRKVIAIAEGKADSTTLPEEFAHIIIDNEVPGYELERALKYVERTNEFKEEYDKYYSVYKEQHPDWTESQIDTKIKKEVLGKLLGAHIIKKIERKSDHSLIRMLRRIFEKFINLFKSKDTRELENFLSRTTDSIFVDPQAFHSGQVTLEGNLLTESPVLTISVNNQQVGSVALSNRGSRVRVNEINLNESIAQSEREVLTEQILKELGEQTAAIGLSLVSNSKAADQIGRAHV